MWAKRGLSCLLAVLFLVMTTVVPKWYNQKELSEYSVVCFGDSILGQVRTEYSITGLMEQRLQMPVYNAAFGGTNMSRIDDEKRLEYTMDSLSMVALAEAIAYKDFGPQQSAFIKSNGTDYFEETIDELATIDFSKVNVIFIEHGSNDYNNGVPLYNEKDSYDVYTYTGALRTVLKTLQTRLPDVRIILVTPTYSWFPQWELTCETWETGSGVFLKDYVEAEKQIAEEFGVEIIDNYDLFPHDSMDDCYLYTVDGLHANEQGRQRIADKMVNYLLENPGEKGTVYK